MIYAERKNIIKRHILRNRTVRVSISCPAENNIGIKSTNCGEHIGSCKAITSIHKDGIVACGMNFALVHRIVYAIILFRYKDSDKLTKILHNSLCRICTCAIYDNDLKAWIMQSTHTLECSFESVSIIQCDNDDREFLIAHFHRFRYIVWQQLLLRSSL